MAQVLITWYEIHHGDFPNRCMTCGARGATLVPRKLQTVSVGFMCRIRRWITVELPFCPAHEARPWIALGRTDAAQFTDRGVWMRNLAPGFVDALWDHRERVRRKERQIERLHRALREERLGLKGDESPADGDEETRRRRDRAGRVEGRDEGEPRRDDPAWQRPTPWVLATVAVVLTLGGLLAFMCVLFSAFIALPMFGRVAGGLNGPGQHGFGPPFKPGGGLPPPVVPRGPPIIRPGDNFKF